MKTSAVRAELVEARTRSPFDRLRVNVPWLLILSLYSSTAFADVVYDTAGGTLKGLVVEEHADRIVVSTEQGERTVFRNQIEEVFYAEPERNYLYLGEQALEAGDFSAARGFFLKALQINPALSEASGALERTADMEKKQGLLSAGPNLLQGMEKQWGISLEEGKRLAVVREMLPGSLAERLRATLDVSASAALERLVQERLPRARALDGHLHQIADIGLADLPKLLARQR